MAASLQAQLPLPALFEARFEEGSGNFVTNSGTAGGLGTNDYGLASSAAGLPAFVSNVPSGFFAPAGNYYSINFGMSAGHAPYAGKAIDFPDDVRTNIVGLTQFTLSGWINVTDGSIGGGGNRIFSTWPQNVNNVTANRLTGVDLVVNSNGRLQLGVNQAPDFPTPPTGPFSSANRVTVSSTADATNWLFFAVTYNASEVGSEVKYYFGRADTAAAIDLTASYPRGMVTNCTVPVTLTLGNFMNTPPLLSARDSTSNSRAFRGLMDEIRFFSSALTLEQIQQVQLAGGVVTMDAPGFTLEPVSKSVLENQPVSFSVTVTGTPPISVRWQRESNDIPGASGLTYTLPNVTPADNNASFRAVAQNAFGIAYSSNAVLTVIQDVTPPTVTAVAPARSARNLTNITVTFSEPVETGSAEDPGNYVLNGGSLNTYSAVLQANLRTVLLTVDPLTSGAFHTLMILGVNDRASVANQLTETNFLFFGPPELVPAIVDTRFEEGSGTVTTNVGALGGVATILQQNSLPAFSANVPTGPFAPAASTRSIDFGTVAAGEGARAVDLTTALGSGGTIGGMSAFTICGWLNARDLNQGSGGNRIAFALASGNGPGFDLVQLGTGALRIGVNQWPDGSTPGGPSSSTGKITADAQVDAANWVFFAVTYDSAQSGGEIRYYFGKPDLEAELDVAAPYARGPIVTSGKLTIGNFSTVDMPARTASGPNGPSRIFRGLFDEFQVFDEAYALDQIRRVQRGTNPRLSAVRDANEIVISWDSPGAFQLLYRDAVSLGIWQTNSSVLETNGTRRTARLPFTGSARFFRLQGQ